LFSFCFTFDPNFFKHKTTETVIIPKINKISKKKVNKEQAVQMIKMTKAGKGTLTFDLSSSSEELPV